jgi:hypothetical protein
VLGYDVAGTIPSDLATGHVCTLPTSAGTQETYAKVVHGAGATGGGVTVRQASFASTTGPDTGYVLLRYTFTNAGATTLSGFYAGLLVDWDLLFDASPTTDVMRWDSGLTVGEAVEQDTVAHQQIVGVAPAAASGAQEFRGWLSAADPPNHASYFTILSGGTVTSAQGPGDIRALTGNGPYTLAPGASVVIYFAIVGGGTRTAFTNNLAAARGKVTALGF